MTITQLKNRLEDLIDSGVDPTAEVWVAHGPYRSPAVGVVVEDSAEVTISDTEDSDW